MALVVQLKIPGRTLTEARRNMMRLREVMLAAAEGRADMFAVLAWELEGKAEQMRTRNLLRQRNRKHNRGE